MTTTMIILSALALVGVTSFVLLIALITLMVWLSRGFQ